DPHRPARPARRRPGRQRRHGCRRSARAAVAPAPCRRRTPGRGWGGGRRGRCGRLPTPADHRRPALPGARVRAGRGRRVSLDEEPDVRRFRGRGHRRRGRARVGAGARPAGPARRVPGSGPDSGRGAGAAGTLRHGLRRLHGACGPVARAQRV
ncbi:MAG: hypothetical protein AVDCRST_MAG40-2246, partial [uncultured Gemmatimonadaceae bacterium]